MKKVLVRLGVFLVPFMIVVTFVATFASAATVSPDRKSTRLNSSH